MVVNTIGEPYAFEVFLKIEKLLAGLVALVLGIECFESAAYAQVVATILIIENVAAM